MDNSQNEDKKILLIANRLYSIYNYIFTKEEYDRLISGILINTDTNNIELTIINYLNNYITNHLNECLKEPNKFLNIIFRFINTNMSLKNRYTNCLNELRKLTNLLKDVNFNNDSNIFIELIENSEVLKGNLKYIIDYNKNLVWSSRIDEIFEDEVLVSLIDGYCLLNNVYEENDYVDFGNKLIGASYDLYLKDINGVQVNYSDEELLKKIKNGDMNAKNMLIYKHLKYVANIAKQYIYFGFDILDLIEEGNIALMAAVDKFDTNYNCKFTTFAYWKIRKSIHNFICTNISSMKLSASIYLKYNSFNATYRKYYLQYGLEPSLEELASIMNTSLEEVERLYWLRDSLIDVDDFKDKLEEDSLADNIFLNLMTDDLRKVLDDCDLTENEKIVITLRFGLSDDIQRTYAYIGEILNKQRNSVKSIEVTALKKLRKMKLIKSFAIYMNYPDKALLNLKRLKSESKKR